MNILIHLGFPKTASSTLQFGPLATLERDGHLNLYTWRKKDPTELLENRPSSSLFLGKKIRSEYLDFSETKLNVLSDESFTAPSRLRECNFGVDLQDPFSFPEKIRSQIINAFPDQKINLTWIGIIRNQCELIQSQYVEEYNWKRFKNLDLLFNSKGSLDLTGYEIYDFYEYISQISLLEEKFGDKSLFLLYEDMTGDPEYFFEKLDDIFETKNGYFHSAFRNSHKNSRNKTEFGAFTKDGLYFVPRMTELVAHKISEHYSPLNESLCKFFDREKLLRYGYIRA